LRVDCDVWGVAVGVGVVQLDVLLLLVVGFDYVLSQFFGDDLLVDVA